MKAEGKEKDKKSTVKRITRLFILAPFAICVDFLSLLGKCTRLSYVQISVVFNLWIRGGVLLLSSFMPLVSLIRHCTIAAAVDSILILVGVLLLYYVSLYVFGFVFMLKHYRLPLEGIQLVCGGFASGGTLVAHELPSRQPSDIHLCLSLYAGN